ncbi:aspartyl/glutamyl-tRNA amidotransferase subunit B domain protein [Streptococcus constellatus subsp. pharyngis SK1060 = CCUG 46377]|uniref:Aspartyl/glutamyl-tRNA amidotransferase subunit B domain protein n=1 Tax=Streptococcus constellatus subsp. pharyngis SK1060 = CCUG 46377 TaxID=1035184 RepID=F9P7D4_STRCV|nr:aspartyl/glutamyl-tRNA amidotransferase subunit B domain protein [Streptococcus constellatus subsp. pharyngis SK1060 = CCUG 46377]
MNFETIIGLEVHVELKTNSKIFSPAPAHFGEDPNTNTNIIDWSFPGVLPVMNKGVIDYGIKAALALNMDIHQKMHFDRKNYFIQIILKPIKFLNLMSPLAIMAGLKSS